jgi:hypothetical protein
MPYPSPLKEPTTKKVSWVCVFKLFPSTFWCHCRGEGAGYYQLSWKVENGFKLFNFFVAERSSKCSKIEYTTTS